MRAMFTPGASNTCSARSLASVPITLPNRLATEGSNDAARAMAEGKAVALADDGSVYTETSTRSPPIITKTGGIVAETQSFWPMPTGPLVMRSVGMQRRNSGHVAPALALWQLGND